MVGKKIYLVLENRAMLNGCITLRAYADKQKAKNYAHRMAKRQKNKPQYDDWGLCEGIEYIVAGVKVR